MDDWQEYSETLARAAHSSDIDLIGLTVDSMRINPRLAACFSEQAERLLVRGAYRQAAKAIYEGTICLQEVGNEKVLESFAQNALVLFDKIYEAGALIEDGESDDFNSVSSNIGYTFGKLNEHGYSDKIEFKITATFEEYAVALCLADHADRAVKMAENSWRGDAENNSPLDTACKNFFRGAALWQKAVATGVKPPAKDLSHCIL